MSTASWRKCGIALPLTGEGAHLECLHVPPAEAAHFISTFVRWDDRTVASHLLPTYARVDLAFERGEGAWLIATDGERYLDFAAGVAVNALGHAHPRLVQALTEQAGKLWHVSNLYRIPEGERLAARLCEITFADTVFFGNSGAEAMELAIKMARKFQSANGKPERFRMVTFEGAFHGRTLATIAAGGQKKYLEGFGPPVEGFDQVNFGDLDAVKKAIGPETGAILIEPIQGEGGVRVASPQFMKALRALCDERGLLLVLDEIQTGFCRSGELFAYQRYGIEPDIMAIAKALGGGFPVGACLATAEAAKGMTVGTHGSTFGGNPLAMAVGNAALDVMLAPGFLDRMRKLALLFKQRLAELKDRHPAIIAEVRGEGLLVGLRCAVPNGDLVNALRAEKLLSVAAGDNVVRLLPPLIVSEDEIAQSIGMIDRACARLARAQPAPAQAAGKEAAR
jgi:acetylornithine/N-succinyldiaminopimelate aminotransferase